MKIEMKPLTECKKPRYAAVLAAFASAALLTGCQQAGEVATTGVTQQPTVSEDDLEIMGMEQWCPDSSEDDELYLEGTAQGPPNEDSDEELYLMGEAPIDSEPPDDSWLQLEGDVALAGDVDVSASSAVCERIPELIPEAEGESICEDLAAQTEALNSERADDFAQVAAACAEHSDACFSNEPPAVTVNGMLVPSAGFCEQEGLMFFWFGEDDASVRWIDSLLEYGMYKQYNWGVIRKGSYCGDSCRIVLLSTDVYTEMTPEYAAKIAEDIWNESNAASY